MRKVGKTWSTIPRETYFTSSISRKHDLGKDSILFLNCNDPAYHSTPSRSKHIPDRPLDFTPTNAFYAIYGLLRQHQKAFME